MHLLFEKSKDDPLELVILITSFYGLRRSEVLGLKWSSIDFEKNIITIKHKVVQRNAKKNRTMLLKDKTKNKSSYRSLPLLPVIADVLKKYEKKIHDLRHSCASLLLSKGVPMKAIQEWLGHSTYSTTANFYTHLEDNYKTESANVLANCLKVG